MDGKTKAIVSHITFVGLIVAIILNNTEKDQNASFYIRQQLGLNLICLIMCVCFPVLGAIFALIPILGWIAGMLLGLAWFVIGIGLFVAWIISLIGSIEDSERLVPVVGQYFQDWFKNL